MKNHFINNIYDYQFDRKLCNLEHENRTYSITDRKFQISEMKIDLEFYFKIFQRYHKKLILKLFIEH